MNSNKSDKHFIALVKPTLKDRLGVLFLFFIVMILVTGLLGSLIKHAGLEPRTSILVTSSLQCLLAFMFPAWLTAYLNSPSPFAYLGLSNPCRANQFVFVLVFLILIGPFMNLVVEWNEGLVLPESLNGLYSSMKNLEETAAKTTEIILNDPSWVGLISGVLIIGCLTGLAEEMFFRAGFQKAMHEAGINAHVAVWTAAFIFSLLHFQFFGFVPRLLLGAIFGYAYWFSGSLWVSAFMHAANNSWVVIISWLKVREDWPSVIDFDRLGTSASGQVWGALLSLALAIMFVALFGKYFLSSSRVRQRESSKLNLIREDK